MFGKKRKQELIMGMFENYKPTSKSSLKSFCIMVSKGNIDEAERLYNFYIKDMDDLPMFDPQPPTWADNAKQTVGSFFDFVKENKDGFGQVYDLFRNFMAARGKNLPSMGGETPSNPLPPIN